MNDLISRSELIAQLEGFKLSLGDVILGFVVDRVIEHVQEMPGVAAEPVATTPCEYCAGEEKLYQFTANTKLSINTFGKARTLVTECDPCPPHVRCSMWKIPARSAFLIKFCPECGRRLMNEEVTP